MILANLREIEGEISSVCNHLGRNPESITLVGVTKYADAALVNEALKAGLCHIGENRVQDAKEKFSALIMPDHPVKKHLIGHLQSNKVKAAVEMFDMIQSVDSVKLVGEIEKHAAALNKIMDILIQVNVSGEEQKFGVDPDSADVLMEEAAASAHIRTLGLMTIAPFTDDTDIVRNSFKGLKAMFDRYAEIYKDHNRVSMDILSMGMTQDFRIALEEGATMVRIGSAIFQ